MNKKVIIFAISIFTVLLVIVAGIVISTRKTNDSANFGSMTKDNYYVEKGVEAPAEIAHKAVEAYLTQDRSESKQARKERLEKYFTDDSSVYDYTPDYLSASIDKTTAKVTSAITCEEQEGVLCLDVTAEIKSYSGNNYEKTTVTYWTSIEDNNESYKVIDLGIKK